MSATGNILKNKMRFVAATLVVATLLFSCKEELPVTEVIDPSSVPTQIVEEMILDQSKGGDYQ